MARNTHNAATLRPYDANEATGNVSPTTPKPKKANKCGVFGQILLAAVAIAVTAIAPFGSAGTVSLIGNAVAGSVASQAVGLATGIQSKFSFKGVAMAAISAGVGVKLDGIGGAGFGGDVVRGALGSAVTQGVGVATGLQSRFSWAGVAAAGIGNGFGGAVSRALGSDDGLMGIKADARTFGNDLGASAASLLANAATRSVLTGSSFGDNLMRGLPDALGGVVGRAVGGAARGSGKPTDLLAGTPHDSTSPAIAQARAVGVEATSNSALSGVTTQGQSVSAVISRLPTNASASTATPSR